MAFDPFGDFETAGYLRNFAGQKDPQKVKQLEHNSFVGNVGDALRTLDAKSTLSFQDIRDTHRTLFKDVYPWAGESRDQNAKDLHITKGSVAFQLAPAVPRGIDYALTRANKPAAFKADVGNTIGELAYAHPFLDGNGRTITTVVDALARKANIRIEWERTDKADYLKALTKEIDEPNKQHLSNYLQPFIREGARSLESIEKTLTRLPGLSAPEAASREKVQQPTFVLVAGPNGAGKSTLSASEAFKDFKVIDPDAIARKQSFTGSEAPLNAFREAVRQQQEQLTKGESFITETTLAATNGIRLLQQAKEAGFKTELHFVGLKDVEQSHERVTDRVKTGGHNIAPETLDQRFPNVLKNLPEAISTADKTVLYDNSGDERHIKIAELTREKSTFQRDTPKWAASAALNSAILDQERATSDQASVQATHRAYDAARAAGISNEEIKQINQETLQRQNEQVRQNQQAEARRQSRQKLDRDFSR